MVKNISGTNYITTYEYNLAGELKRFTYPSGRAVEQSYDAAGRPTAIFQGATNYASAFAYNPAGQVTGFNYSNGVTASFTYSPERLQVQSLTYRKDTQNLFKLTYGYTQNGGNNGQITSTTDDVDSTRSLTYSYDPLGRLKVAFAGPEATPTWKLDWDYDRYGNRPNQNVRAGSPPGPQLTINPFTNRITGTGYSYDANGNMTADGLNSLAYDAESRVVSVNGSTSYSYDGNGLRVKKVSGSTTVYIFSGTKVIAEYVNGAPPGSPTREYVYSGSALLATIEGGTTRYHHADHLSVRVVTDSNGTVIGQRGLYPFGDSLVWYETGSTDKWKFTSYERDGESVNDYAMARYYINRFGRFSSADPIAGSVADPQSLNRYSYVTNDPINWVDPLGLTMVLSYPGCMFTSDGCYGGGGGGGGGFWWPDPFGSFRGNPFWDDPLLRCILQFPFGHYPTRAELDAAAASCMGKVAGARIPVDPCRGPGCREDREPANQSVVQKIKGLAKTVVCAVTQPLQTAAYQNQGAVGLGLGGSFGVGLIWGASVQGGIQVVADPSGRVGIAFTGGGNPGFGVLGVGGVGGVQFMSSDAQSIFDLGGQSFGGGVSGGVSGVGAGIDVASSKTSSSMTITVGAGIGGRGSAVATTGTSVPQALSLTCN